MGARADDNQIGLAFKQQNHRRDDRFHLGRGCLEFLDRGPASLDSGNGGIDVAAIARCQGTQVGALVAAGCATTFNCLIEPDQAALRHLLIVHGRRQRVLHDASMGVGDLQRDFGRGVRLGAVLAHSCGPHAD